MSTVVVDTSVFTNPDSFQKLGKTSIHAFKKTLNYAQEHKINLYITHGCWMELQQFIPMNTINNQLLANLHIQSPDRDRIAVSGTFLHEVVCEFRKRGDAALKYGTKIVREAYDNVPQPREKGKPEPVFPYISKLRDGYRHHLRTNFIDSGEDLDTLLLAKQLKARLVTSDLGMVAYANRLGVELLEPLYLLSI